MAEKIQEFVIGSKRQDVWGWPIATAFFTAAIGSGLFLVTLWEESQRGKDLNLAILVGLIVGGIATSLAFIYDLGRRDRFWRVLLKPGSSWISRGIILIAAMVIFGILYGAPGWLVGLPWDKADGLGKTFQIISALAAFGVIIYTGFLLSYSPSIPFWNTPLLPILFVFYALMGGISSLFALSLVGGLELDYKFLELALLFLIIATLILIGVYLMIMYYSTKAAREASTYLFKGNLAWLFLGGVVGVGLVVPFIITLSTYIGGGSLSGISGILVISGVLELLGAWLFRYSLLKVGVYSPLM